MASGSVETNISPVNDDDKRVIGGRATDEERMAVDIAAAKLGARRGHFVIAACLEIAEAVEAGDEPLIARMRERIKQIAA